MGSIEAAFIGLARYMRDHFPDLNWMPLWYAGTPFPDTYTPLLHATVAAVSGIGHISAALAYHAVTATLYALGPVALYWALLRLGSSRAAAFTAAAGYSLFSPTIWLVPSMRHDSGGWLAACRLDAMVRWGEGPHIAALTLLPLAIGALYIALERRTPARYFAAAVAMAAAALTNWIGGFALALIGTAFLLAKVKGAWPRLALIACWAYAIAAPFVTPSTVATVQANAPLVANGYKPNYPLQAAFVAGALLLAFALFKKRIDPRIRFAALLLYFTATIALPAYWFRLEVIPQPNRYHLEMDLAFWLLAGLLAPLLAAKVGVRRVGVFAAAAFCLAAAIAQHQRAQEIEKPIAIASTAEYEISTWLGAHQPGVRVFAPGTIGFWMNAFSDTAMLNGGFDNGERNLIMPHVIFQVYFGEHIETALAWLKAFGVGAIVGGAPGSREVFHPYAHPDKFNGLAEIWRDGSEVIYAVPRRRTSLAHAMLPSDLPRETPPAYDNKSLDHYLAALDDPALPDASFTWHGASRATITASLRPEYVLSVQVTFDKGWTARVNGEPRPILADKLGQMIVEPRCSGPCAVDLVYDGGLEQQSARWLSGAALLAGLIVIIKERLRK